MKITQRQFTEQLNGKAVSVHELKQSNLTSSTENQLARADLNNDGFIQGEEEAKALFKQIDHYDRNGDANSISTNNENVLKAHQAVLGATKSVEAPRSNTARTGLQQLLADNPSLQTNQDLINLFMKRNGNNWNKAATAAKRHGVDINSLVGNREGRIQAGSADNTTVRPAEPVRHTASTGRIGNVAGMENTSPAFRQKVVEVAERLKMDPTHLMAVMSFETGETFSSSVKNRHTGATGLIQFMPKTARSLGTSTSALAQMSPERQLDYVEKYLEPYAGKMNSVEDAYMAVLWPAAVGDGPNRVLFKRGTRTYRQNSGLDINNNGHITAREAANKVRAKIR